MLLQILVQIGYIQMSINMVMFAKPKKGWTYVSMKLARRHLWSEEPRLQSWESRLDSNCQLRFFIAKIPQMIF